MSAVIEGVGVHSGAHCRVHLHRDDGPLRFVLGGARIPARLEAVVATPRCVVLGDGGAARIATVEHLLAALRVAGFWSGVAIEVSGPEVPILDGSAAPWLDALATLGPAPAAPPAWRPARTLALVHGSTRLELTPGPERLDVGIDYDHPAIGRQRWSGGPDDYAGVLSARTYVTHVELATLLAAGGLRGAAEGRGIVFGGDGPQAALRWPDEPVRHKALDALGDFALLGVPLEGCLTIERGSHAAHVAFMQRLRTLAPAPTPALSS